MKAQISFAWEHTHIPRPGSLSPVPRLPLAGFSVVIEAQGATEPARHPHRRNRKLWEVSRLWHGPLTDGRWESVDNDSPFIAPEQCPEMQEQFLSPRSPFTIFIGLTHPLGEQEHLNFASILCFLGKPS